MNKLYYTEPSEELAKISKTKTRYEMDRHTRYETPEEKDMKERAKIRKRFESLKEPSALMPGNGQRGWEQLWNK